MDTNGIILYTICVLYIISASASINGDHLPHDSAPLPSNFSGIELSNSTTLPRHPHPLPPPTRRGNAELWKWWVVGFGVAFLGLILVGLAGVVISKGFASTRIRWMERKSEKSEALGTKWIRDSRMPSASMVRTQATLENEYAT